MDIASKKAIPLVGEAAPSSTPNPSTGWMMHAIFCPYLLGFRGSNVNLAERTREVPES